MICTQLVVHVGIELDLHRLGGFAQPVLLVLLFLDLMLRGVDLLRELDARFQLVQEVQLDRHVWDVVCAHCAWYSVSNQNVIDAEYHFGEGMIFLE